MVSIESELKEIRMVGLVEVRRRKGRVVGFLKLQELYGGTQLAAAPNWPPGAIPETCMVFCSRKTLFFVLFAVQEPPGATFVIYGR